MMWQVLKNEDSITFIYYQLLLKVGGIFSSSNYKTLFNP